MLKSRIIFFTTRGNTIIAIIEPLLYYPTWIHTGLPNSIYSDWKHVHRPCSETISLQIHLMPSIPIPKPIFFQTQQNTIQYYPKTIGFILILTFFKYLRMDYCRNVYLSRLSSLLLHTSFSRIYFRLLRWIRAHFIASFLLCGRFVPPQTYF